MKTVIYTRGHDSEQQLEKCRDFAGERGLEVMAIAQTPEELEHTILSGDYSIVLVSHISRLTRRYSEYIAMQQVFDALGVEIAVAE